jgi:hypothetical protein
MQTWQTIIDFVSQYQSRDAGTPNQQLYRMLGNQALAILAAKIGPLEATWTNAEGGGLTLSGNAAALPEGCLSVVRVAWNGDVLRRKDVAEMDYDDPDWRTRTGTPGAYYTNGTNLFLDCIPSGAGDLTVTGNSSLGTFSEAEGAVNPLSYLPESAQLAPAYYILSMLPAEERFTYKDGQIVSRDTSELERRQMFAAMWQAEIDNIQNAVNARRYEPFRF